LPFTLNLCKLPAELINDCFALAYIIPAHDKLSKDGSPEKNDMQSIAKQSIAEECSTDVEQKQLQDRMKDVVNASLDPMFALTNDGKIVVANAAAVNAFGYSHDELEGKSIATICPTAREVQNILNFMHLESSLNKKQKTKATTKAGDDLSVELGISVNQNMSNESIYFAHMKDLSEIEHKDDLCQQMINSSFDPMFSIDQRGSILIVNEAACQAFGYTRDEMIGQNIKIICNKHDAKHHDAHLQRYLSFDRREAGNWKEEGARCTAKRW
jgi:PAS domain S-box-containing protein